MSNRMPVLFTLRHISNFFGFLVKASTCTAVTAANVPAAVADT
jgi:hypothetical protein